MIFPKTPALPLVARTVAMLGFTRGFPFAAPAGDSSFAAAFALPPSVSRLRAQPS